MIPDGAIRKENKNNHRITKKETAPSSAYSLRTLRLCGFPFSDPSSLEVDADGRVLLEQNRSHHQIKPESVRGRKEGKPQSHGVRRENAEAGV